MQIEKWIKRILVGCMLVVFAVVSVAGLINYHHDPTTQGMWHVLLEAVMLYAAVVCALILKSRKVI